VLTIVRAEFTFVKRLQSIKQGPTTCLIRECFRARGPMIEVRSIDIGAAFNQGTRLKYDCVLR
jgi:hypothetical protein